MRTSFFSSRRATLIFALVVLLAAIVVASSSDGATALISNPTYTLDADFDEGTLLNVNHDAPNNDQLQLNETTTPFPFIWVALSGRDTIAKVDTVTGTVLGEYLSAPDGRGRNPSRTTVDLDGNVWVSNRNESSGGQGSVVHIGLEENLQCVDRNDNGVIDTSTGLGDVRPWLNPAGVDDAGGVSSAEDECIIHYVRTSGTAARTVAVDANNDVWVGGYGNRVHELIDGGTGTIVPGTTFGADCGGYGGLVDGNGVLWSARGGGALLRYDPATSTGTCISISNSYGLGVDSSGNVWNAQWSNNTITKIAPDGTIINTFPTGGNSSRGVAVTADDNIWVANSGSDTVTRLANDGTLLATVSVGDQPTGVAVDAAGKVWTTNLGSDNAMRIDPATDTVDLTVALGAGASPYNYSDMTGMVSLGTTAPQGTWTIIFDSEEAGTEWGKVSWNTENLQNCPATAAEREPAGTSITTRARSAESVAGLGGATYIDAPNGADIDPPNGRYLQVEVKLTPNDDGDSPIVCDVTIETTAPPITPTPSPSPGVGGIVDIAVDGPASLVASAEEASGGSSVPYSLVLAGGLMAAAVALTAGGWYARRRLS